MADTGEYRVWIDQDLCTGDGLCEEIEHKIFTILDDSLAYVKDERGVFDDSTPELPKGAKGLVYFEVDQFEAVDQAAEECPGECIFIEDRHGKHVGHGAEPQA
jgi:ferredoxin